MRRRELIAVLKEIRLDLRKASPGLFSSFPTAQQQAEKRLNILHRLENLVPEITEKLADPR